MKSLQAPFGGTLDPVYYGHLKPVEALASLIGLPRVIIMPNSVPPHRTQPEAPGEQRQRMVELAITDKPLFSLDEHEPKRDTASYTAQTLKEWREEQGPEVPSAFIVGQDSLLTFPSWHDYDTTPGNTHSIVCQRPGYLLEMAQEKHQQWLEDHLTHSLDDLYSLPCGKIYLAEASRSNVPAMFIRERLEKGEPCDDLMPTAVLDYTDQQELYR